MNGHISIILAIVVIFSISVICGQSDDYDISQFLSGDFASGDFLSGGLLAGDLFSGDTQSGVPLESAKMNIRVAPGTATDVGMLSTKEPVFGIIKGTIESHKVAGYVTWNVDNVVAVPAGETYWEGMGRMEKALPIRFGDENFAAFTWEYSVNRSGISYGGDTDYYIYMTSPWYNSESGEVEFIMAYNITSGSQSVDLYLV